jgi:hypothetical protein
MTICMVLLRDGTEPATVLGRADAERLDERAAHGLGGAVTAGTGGLLDAFGRVLQVTAGGFQAGPLDVPAGGQADLGGERAGEVPW